MATPHPARRRAGNRRRAAVAVIAVGAAVPASPLAGLSAGPAFASIHREAPLISGDPPVDNTDVYSFVSPDKPDTVTLIANWYPFEEPHGGPNFHPWVTDAHHDINIDNNGDAKADLTYRWNFRTDDRRGNNTYRYARKYVDGRPIDFLKSAAGKLPNPYPCSVNWTAGIFRAFRSPCLLSDSFPAPIR
ncbi:hypothetical protein HDA45_000639 [Amycolatopsis umgeniensis]|uniref:DUF4331 domain-containing protein n=2 Tax=Amycolatopsis umgeniensis TaxID=336628 RepID=A0A841AW19_9PSEU|nr:DUF4331 family protein [Amycolatopsis umgeniensis]MBB5850552.1 hypothetical protein [Amycolatopsis umgeniensis]